MRFGVCTELGKLQVVKNAGYDYAEVYLRNVVDLPEEEFVAVCARIREVGIPVETCAVLFKQGQRLTGEVDMDELEQYVRFAMGRAQKLGAEIAVLGCGNLRAVPEEIPHEQAREQFKSVLRMCGDIAGEYGIKIALEPLNRNETNLINTLEEGLALCRELNHPHVGLTADFYHIHMVNDSVEMLELAGDYLFHVHIARPDKSRLAPIEDDRETCVRWASALKKCNYRGRMTLEMGSASDFEGELQKMMKMSTVFR